MFIMPRKGLTCFILKLACTSVFPCVCVRDKLNDYRQNDFISSLLVLLKTYGDINDIVSE